ncbi:MAG: FMN-binding protein [Myxococcota bacterium]
MSAAPPRLDPGVWPMYRAMVGVGLACGLLIVGVYQLTKPVIERNEAEALQRAIFQVLPAARASIAFERVEQDWRSLEPGARATGPVVHAAYDADQQLVGVAVEAGQMGYQDVIRLLYGYAPDEQAIVGIRVLESRETPGLGDRIEKDPDFLQNFERLDVSLVADGSALAHAIEAVKHGEKEHPWQVDGITGATISSVAVADALAHSASAWIPLIRRDLDAFRWVE